MAIFYQMLFHKCFNCLLFRLSLSNLIENESLQEVSILKSSLEKFVLAILVEQSAVAVHNPVFIGALKLGATALVRC